MTGTKAERVLKYLIGIAAFFVLTPILIAFQDIWDGWHIYEAYFTKDPIHLKHLLLDTNWTLQYYMYVGLEKLQDTVGIPYKPILNLLAASSVAGIAVEVYRRLREDLGIEKEFCLLGSLTLLVLPPWGTLICSVLAFHASCAWAFLLAVRFRSTQPVLAGILLVYSLFLNSVFAFAVGYTAFKGLQLITKDNWKSVFTKVFLISAVLLTAFISYRHFFPPDAWGGTYNTFNPRYSGFLNFIKSAVVISILTFVLFGRKADPEERINLARRIGGLLILTLFAGLAYWYVGRSVKLMGTNSFSPRHAFLMVIPAAMLLATFSQHIKKSFGAKLAYGTAGLIILLSFIYQFTSFQQKFTQLYYENAMLEALKEIEEPKPGLVVINAIRKTIPKELRDSPNSTTPIFLKAYGHRNWMLRVCSEDDNNCETGAWEDSFLRPYVVDHLGFAEKDLYKTQLKYTIDNFNVFGSPLYYYYYFTNAFDRLNPRFEVEFVERYNQ